MWHRVLRTAIYLGFLLGTLPETPLRAESGHDAWLRFARLDVPAAKMYETLPTTVVVLGHSVVLESAEKELTRGIKQMLEKTVRTEPDLPQETSFILGTLKEVQAAIPEIRINHKIADDAFWLIKRQAHGFPRVIVTGSTDRGVLYGVFAFLSKIARNESITR